MIDFLVTFLPLAIVISSIVYASKKKSKNGINLKTVHCPNCNYEMPKFRKPQSLKEAMWGSSTCPQCGLKMDKWGREDK